MKSLYRLWSSSLVSLAILLPCSCGREKLSEESVVESYLRTPAQTELDAWITREFSPYNLQVHYRWQKENLPSGSIAIPPKTDRVQLVLEAVKQLCLELYRLERAGGKDFLLGKGIIRITLLGGYELDATGVLMRLWYPQTASNELFIFDTNTFDPTDRKSVYRLMRSVHHQFARRLIEHIPYDRNAFLAIGAKAYGSLALPPSPREVYRRVGMSEYAHRRGFYTLYSMASPEDEFAELISVFLLHSAVELKRVEEIAARPISDQPGANEEAQEALRLIKEKRAFVERYFKQQVGISLSRLQLLSLKQLNAYYTQHQSK